MVYAGNPEPAKVVTLPSRVTALTLWLWVSNTYKFNPRASMVIPQGPLNRAFVPQPSAYPIAPGDPARVETALKGWVAPVIALIVLPLHSPTYTAPQPEVEGAAASPAMLLKELPAPTPSTVL